MIILFLLTRALITEIRLFQIGTKIIPISKSRIIVSVLLLFAYIDSIYNVIRLIIKLTC